MRRNATSLCLLGLFLVLASGCQAAKKCPEGSITYGDGPAAMPVQAIPAGGAAPTPSLVEIAGRMVEVSRVISGPVCNDTWRGTVYVSCNVQLLQWDKEEKPLFFKGCNLTIEPDTVVYVAAHQDTAYYNGCSCHTGEEP